MYVAIFASDDLQAAAEAVQTLFLTSDPPGIRRDGGGSGTGVSWLAGRLAAVPGALAASGADPRLLLAFALSLAWGCRLTYNFWRRGGYNLQYEDYRWTEARKIMSPWLYEVFNLVFVALAQNILCMAITLPAFVAKAVRGVGPDGRPLPPAPLGAADWAAAGVFVLLLAGETAADQQQWAFQTRKHALLAAVAPREGDYRRGFRTSGLFRFSRHPSFFCEYGMWWAFYVLCAALPSRCALGPAAAGAAGLTLLFHAGSLWITERISAGRYPDYREYQRTTSAIVPWWPGPRLKDREE